MWIRKDAEERRVFLYVIMRLFHLRDIPSASSFARYAALPRV